MLGTPFRSLAVCGVVGLAPDPLWSLTDGLGTPPVHARPVAAGQKPNQRRRRYWRETSTSSGAAVVSSRQRGA